MIDLTPLVRSGWRFTRDGSTAMAVLLGRDPDDPACGWELQVLLTEGHSPRFSLLEWEGGLTEQTAATLAPLREALDQVDLLLKQWSGETVELE